MQVFDKVVPGVTYTKKVVLRNREHVGRRMRLELDPKSPFRLSLPIYPGDGISLDAPNGHRAKGGNGFKVSGIIATGMCVQVGTSITYSLYYLFSFKCH